jgi:hypothetical protein
MGASGKEQTMMIEEYWESIPIDKPITYDELREIWGKDKRKIRNILHELSAYDSGDNYILIRSASGKGFFRTDNREIIEAYKRECLAKGKSIFAPIKKINRVLNDAEDMQSNVFNNLKAIRNAKGITQAAVVEYMKQFDNTFDAPTLSKLENGVFLPTPYQVIKLALFFDCEPLELVALDLYALDVCVANKGLASCEKGA